MRYTTLIDITELPSVYRNINARLVYLHLALKSGYHDNDRDQCNISIRQLAISAGLTVSATRHALHVLMAANLLTKVGGVWVVKKWLVEDPPTPRTRKTAAAAAAAQKDKEYADKLQEQYRREQIDNRLRLERAIRACSVDELKEWRDEIAAGTRKTHHGYSCKPSAEWVAWFDKYIDRVNNNK